LVLGPVRVVRPEARPAPPTNQLDDVFGGQIRLVGDDVRRQPDGSLRLRLVWTATRPPDADYTVFVHLLSGTPPRIVGQQDSQPRGGAAPTSTWAVGEVIDEEYILTPSATGPDLTLELGL